MRNTLADFRRLLEQLDPASTHPASWILDRLAELDLPVYGLAADGVPDADTPWTERLWTVPVETRLTLEQVAQACGRSLSWVYQRSGPSCDPEVRLPVRRLDGTVVVTAGDLRAWLRRQEGLRGA